MGFWFVNALLSIERPSGHSISIICCVAIVFVPLSILMFIFVFGSKLSLPVVSASVFTGGGHLSFCSRLKGVLGVIFFKFFFSNLYSSLPSWWSSHYNVILQLNRTIKRSHGIIFHSYNNTDTWLTRYF